ANSSERLLVTIQQQNVFHPIDPLFLRIVAGISNELARNRQRSRKKFATLLFVMSVATDIERIHREEWGRVVATLIRLTGDFDVAEDAAQEAFAAAVEQWPAEGVPQSPRAWIVRTGYHKAIDRIRRRALLESKRHELRPSTAVHEPELSDDAIIE